MLLPRCRSVHTVGMRFPIDAVLLDASLHVVAVVRMRPWRVLRPRLGSRHVLEVAADSGIRAGDRFITAQGAGVGATPWG